MQATPEEIKQQFRRLALQHHPDKAGNGGEEDVSRFTAIRDAFQTLKDPAARSAYDKTLLHQLDMQVRGAVPAKWCPVGVPGAAESRVRGLALPFGRPLCLCRRLWCSLSTSTSWP